MLLVTFSSQLCALSGYFWSHSAARYFVFQLSLVNLNSMLCPAVSDPFYGPYYRVYACIHQTALILLHGKIYTLVALLLIPQRAPVSAPAAVGSTVIAEEINSNGSNSKKG